MAQYQQGTNRIARAKCCTLRTYLRRAGGSNVRCLTSHDETPQKVAFVVRLRECTQQIHKNKTWGTSGRAGGIYSKIKTTAM